MTPHPLTLPQGMRYDAGVSKEMVLENTDVNRSNRPDSAVLSCPNSVPSFGQDGESGNASRTTLTGVFNILPTLRLKTPGDLKVSSTEQAMTNKKEPEALRLADELEEPLHDFPEPTTLEAKAAAELRRLHAENEMRRAALLDEMQKAARLEIESLRKEHADELAAVYMRGTSREKELAAPPNDEQIWAAREAWAKQTNEHEAMRAALIAGRASHGQAPHQSGVGNSGFDHKTAADFLNGKTVSDEAVRKFVAASRWAHDDRASLQATLQSVRNELASREAEIALLKTALMNAEEAAPTTRPAPGEQNESAYQRGYMDGMAKGRHEVEAAPRQEAQEQFIQGAAWAAAQIKEWMAAPTFTNLFDGVQNRDATRVIADWPQHITELAEIAAPQPSPAAQGDALVRHIEGVQAKAAA